jgi:hypothetical protein
MHPKSWTLLEVHIYYGNYHCLSLACEHSVTGNDSRAVLEVSEDIFLEFIGVVGNYPHLHRALQNIGRSLSVRSEPTDPYSDWQNYPKIRFFAPLFSIILYKKEKNGFFCRFPLVKTENPLYNMLSIKYPYDAFGKVWRHSRRSNALRCPKG